MSCSKISEGLGGNTPRVYCATVNLPSLLIHEKQIKVIPRLVNYINYNKDKCIYLCQNKNLLKYPIDKNNYLDNTTIKLQHLLQTLDDLFFSYKEFYVFF